MQNEVANDLEDQLFEILSDIFRLEETSALDVSSRATDQIASFVADVGAISRSPQSNARAVQILEQLKRNLEELCCQLLEFQSGKVNPTLH